MLGSVDPPRSNHVSNGTYILAIRICRPRPARGIIGEAEGACPMTRRTPRHG